MSEQTNKCEACFGTGNAMRMRAPQWGRNILFWPCPKCAGTGTVPRQDDVTLTTKAAG
jgi:DnaJ-class molecular chaperone